MGKLPSATIAVPLYDIDLMWHAHQVPSTFLQLLESEHPGTVSLYYPAHPGTVILVLSCPGTSCSTILPSKC
eukprot:3513103-Rhodomonas_salina.1